MPNVGPKKKTALVAVAAVALVSAVLVFLFKGEDDLSDIPNDEASRAPWMCRECGKGVMLTPREQFDLESKGVEVARKTVGKQVTSARATALQCPSCGAFSLTTALKCSACGKPYLPTPQPSGGHCPDCADKAVVKPGRPSGAAGE